VSRPAGVPTEAEWRFEVDEWVSCPRNAAGEYHGTIRSFRADGTPSAEYEFVDGRRHGAFRTFHPSGALAREGRYAEDRLDGWLVVHTDGEGRLHTLRECCVPEGARLLRQEYASGALGVEAFFDRDGRQLMPDGAWCPARPPGVEEGASFDVVAREWAVSARRAGAQREGVARRFSEAGALIEEVTWAADRREGITRRFAVTGELIEQSHWERGYRHGAHLLRRGASSAEAVFERGTFERDHPVGCWRLEAASGELIAERDLGVARSEAEYRDSPAFEDHARDAGHFRKLSASLRAEGRIFEALCAVARWAAKSGELRGFLDEVAGATLPRDLLPPQAIADQAPSITGTLMRCSSAWLLGAETKLVLEALSRTFGAEHRAGLDFLSAALLLAPDDDALLLRRAATRFEMGDPFGMEADLARLHPGDREVLTLRQRTQTLYRGFDFADVYDDWREAAPEGLPGFAEVDLGRITITMRKAATRLELVRSALIEACERSGLGRPAFLPPETGLLDAVAEPLERSSFELDDDGAVFTVTIDETLDLIGLGVPGLLERALLEWAALCLLAWAAGLDTLELPRELRGRDEFERALATSMKRCQIFDDCRKSLARRKDYPEERFRGIPVPELATPVVSFASAHYREVRAVLFYLTDPECRSLWQDDLRPA
jgi:hypothetical protein